jgi:hypothetical protein
MVKESIGDSTDSEFQKQWNPFWLRGMQFFILKMYLAFQILCLKEMDGKIVFQGFKGNAWEVPVEHLLDFHECMYQ